MITRLLVANRGEIAGRVFATCRRLGIETVAVHSDADADLPYVAAAGSAVHLPGNTPAETYLRGDVIIEAEGKLQMFDRDGKYPDLAKVEELIRDYDAPIDVNGKVFAHGGNPTLVGKDMSGAKDADGKFFIKEIINAAKTKGTGWIDYKWANPKTQKIDPKSTYYMKAGDVILGCGIYKQ